MLWLPGIIKVLDRPICISPPTPKKENQSGISKDFAFINVFEISKESKQTLKFSLKQ